MHTLFKIFITISVNVFSRVVIRKRYKSITVLFLGCRYLLDGSGTPYPKEFLLKHGTLLWLPSADITKYTNLWFTGYI